MNKSPSIRRYVALLKLRQINSQGAHFLEEDISLFDAPFFNIGPMEAKVTVITIALVGLASDD